MADLVSNVGKGTWAYYAQLTQANDALIAIPLQSSGMVADDALVDFDTLADILASAVDEQTTLGRKTLAGVTVTINDTTNVVSVDANDLSWTSASGNACSDIVVCVDLDTTAGTDANLIPLFFLDFVTTPDGTTINATVHASGLATAT